MASVKPVLNVAEPAVSHNNLGTINGCYIPCLLNILGAVLFLRVGFAVGMMGWLGALGDALHSHSYAVAARPDSRDPGHHGFAELFNPADGF